MEIFKRIFKGAIFTILALVFLSCGGGKCATELQKDKQACNKIKDARTKEACFKAANENYAHCKKPDAEKKTESGGYGGADRSDNTGGYK